MPNYIIGIYTAFRSHGIITHYSTEICDCMHVHVCCWARGGPGWSVDFWCECFALPSACRFSDVSLLYLGWPNFLHVYKEEKHVRCRKHASQSLVAVGKGFASTCLDRVAFYHLLVTPNYGLMLSSGIVSQLAYFKPQAIAVVGEAAAELFEPYYDHVLSLGMQLRAGSQGSSYPITLSTDPWKTAANFLNMNSHFSKLPIGRAHRIYIDGKTSQDQIPELTTRSFLFWRIHQSPTSLERFFLPEIWIHSNVAMQEYQIINGHNCYPWVTTGRC